MYLQCVLEEELSILSSATWYLGLNLTEKILDVEVAFKAFCERQTQELMDALSEVLEPPSDVSLIEKEKRKLAQQQVETLAKEEVWKKVEDDEAARLAIKLKAKEDKKVGKKMGKGSKKSRSDSVMSLAASSVLYSTLITLGLTQLTLYPVEVEMNKEHHGNVEIIHDTHQSIFLKKDTLACLEKPLSMQLIDDFTMKHHSKKSKKYRMEYRNHALVDLVVFDILEELRFLVLVF